MTLKELHSSDREVFDAEEKNDRISIVLDSTGLSMLIPDLDLLLLFIALIVNATALGLAYPAACGIGAIGQL